MSERQHAPLFSDLEGELVSVRIRVEPRLLEELLECLAQIDFPINPQIYHGRPTEVEFPAFASRLREIEGVLRSGGFGTGVVSVSPMLDAIAQTN
jgi:hypothetical protein